MLGIPTRMNHRVLNILGVAFLLAGTVIFGWLGQTVEMGLYIVANSIALAFLNIDKLESFKGGGFEAKMGKGIDSASLEAHTQKVLDEAKLQFEKIVEQLPENLPKSETKLLIDRELTSKIDKIYEQIEAENYITVDVSKFRKDKHEWKFRVNDYNTIHDFLDDVFLAIPSVEGFSYNKSWVLRNAATKKLLLEVDRKGPITLKEAGILPGMRLEAVNPSGLKANAKHP